MQRGVELISLRGLSRDLTSQAEVSALRFFVSEKPRKVPLRFADKATILLILGYVRGTEFCPEAWLSLPPFAHRISRARYARSRRQIGDSHHVLPDGLLQFPNHLTPLGFVGVNGPRTQFPDPIFDSARRHRGTLRRWRKSKDAISPLSVGYPTSCREAASRPGGPKICQKTGRQATPNDSPFARDSLAASQASGKRSSDSVFPFPFVYLRG